MLLMQGIGYTEDDSAGQTNIFAVEVSCDNNVTQVCSIEPALAFILPWFHKFGCHDLYFKSSEI